MDNEQVKQYAIDRDKILTDLDAEAMKEFYQKHNPPSVWPSDDVVYEIMMHKCRCILPKFKGTEAELSKKWLADRNYTPTIGHLLN